MTPGKDTGGDIDSVQEISTGVRRAIAFVLKYVRQNTLSWWSHMNFEQSNAIS